MRIWTYLRLARDAAKRDTDDPRCHAVGCVAIRSDGAVVRSKNGHARQKFPEAHAERRVMRKARKDSVVFVARARKGGLFGMAKPCPKCESYLYANGVKKIYYSISDVEYGCINFERV